ncbi:MAG: tetratricopeptide repeat protein, partial [Acidobacteria bacterium]|nr:tetratricopeptide repeat protein [Acidobacteriota bacterium]
MVAAAILAVLLLGAWGIHRFLPWNQAPETEEATGKLSRRDLPPPLQKAFEHLHRLEGKEARQVLEEALTRRPDDALLHHALAGTLDFLGSTLDARTESDKAVARIATVAGPGLRSWIEGRHHRLHRRLEEALPFFREAAAELPELVPLQLELVEVTSDVGRYEEAEAILSRLSAAGPDPRVLLQQARLAALRGDARRHRDLSEQARAAAIAAGSEVLAASARLHLLDAARSLGRIDDLRSGLEELAAVFASTENLRYITSVKGYLAWLDVIDQDFDGGRRRFLEILEGCRSAGYLDGESTTLSALAQLELHTGDRVAQERWLAEVSDLEPKIATPEGDIRLLLVKSKNRHQAGDLETAQSLARQALTSARAHTFQNQEARALQRLGEIEADRGREARAVDSFQQARALTEGLGD